MKRGIDLGQFFGPASLVGVIVGTTYLMLIVLQVVEIGYGFAALVIAAAPLMLTWGWVKQFGTGLALSIIVLPLTVIAFLIGARLGGSVFG
ncbi:MULTISPECIES: hypothetical protein [Mycolicibacterium]|uniref:hypothetical protein n=1 Tax=Mycolicibacterium TaxID=1866885 RepID=UPI00298C07CF|nr:hypothetical protein [Mycolicibacterium sp. D5.8-2]MDW5610065.1 hypothetical protein [Mycolicibacterium sp. D5.8-2]